MDKNKAPQNVHSKFLTYTNSEIAPPLPVSHPPKIQTETYREVGIPRKLVFHEENSQWYDNPAALTYEQYVPNNYNNARTTQGYSPQKHQQQQQQQQQHHQNNSTGSRTTWHQQNLKPADYYGGNNNNVTIGGHGMAVQNNSYIDG